MSTLTQPALDFLRYIGLTVLTLLPIINPVATAALLRPRTQGTRS